MNRDLISRKIESLGRCIVRIESKRPPSLEALLTDVDAQDILSINLERAVQLCVDIGAHVLAKCEYPPPVTMGEVFSQLASLSIIPSATATEMKKAVGFRNLSVHSYDSLDWQRVFDIVHHRTDDFRRFSKCILEWADAALPP